MVNEVTFYERVWLSRCRLFEERKYILLIWSFKRWPPDKDEFNVSKCTHRPQRGSARAASEPHSHSLCVRAFQRICFPEQVGHFKFKVFSLHLWNSVTDRPPSITSQLSFVSDKLFCFFCSLSSHGANTQWSCFKQNLLWQIFLENEA